MVDLAQLCRLVGGDVDDMRMDGSEQIWIEVCDRVVVVFLFRRVAECWPGKVVNDPCVDKVDIRESQ